ncbi:type IV pilin [Methanomethylovorans sp.]|uniref:type IV pilin n=1 Tax=Methanomethylovorans sp. TaxID=2758717 RepID=UPI00345EE486
MKIRLFSDEKGVSPVIGIMLMIVITVILAAAVSSFASTTKAQDAAPQATFTASASVADGYIIMNHLGGDTLYLSRIKAEIGAGTPLMTTYMDSASFTLSPDPAYLRPGDVAHIAFEWYDASTWSATTELDDADGALFNSLSVLTGQPFKLTLIDTNTGQTVYSTTLTLNP